jgi:NADPH2:quinone reductase
MTDAPAGRTALMARVEQWGVPPVVRNLPVPRRRTGQSLVRITAASVTHLDLTIASGTFGIRPELPYVGGTEGVGTVVESDGVAPGTRVSIRGGTLGMGAAGCWAQYAVVADELLGPAPDELPDDLAATYFDPCTTAWTAIHDVGRLAAGETVLIGGAAGAVGSVAAQLARLAGAAEVHGEVSRPDRAPLLPDGVRPVLTGEPAPDELQADLLVDTVGGERLERLLPLVRPAGRAVLVGYTAGTELRLDLPNWLLADVALLPLNMIRRAASADQAAKETADGLAHGRLSLRTSGFRLTELPRMTRALATGSVEGRAVVRPW